MILYHGSKVIVESPEIRIPKYNKDFYFGFYCTLYPEQAIRWAARFDGSGYLNEYEYTPNEALKIKRFPEMSEEWLDFSFHTARALTTLTFVKGVEVHDEE